VPFGDFFIDDWKGIWDGDGGDLKAIQNMKANSIRVYTTSPFSKPNDPNSGRVKHTAFLDACAACNLYVWAAYPTPSNIFVVDKNNPNGKINEQLEKATLTGIGLMASEMAQHPAVIGFITANELNLENVRDKPLWWELMNKLGSAAKERAPDKLSMQCFFDDSMITPRYSKQIGKGVGYVDVFGINSYRGTKDKGFDTLFSDYKAACDKPLLITEFGCPASRHDPNTAYPQGKPIEQGDNAADQSAYVLVHWKDIAANREVCSGGYIFEWCDEWWKQGGFPVFDHDGSPRAAGEFPGGWYDEEWFGICSVAVSGGRPPRQPDPKKPDTRAKRKVYTELQKSW
jgi:hypothetical protein